MKVIAVTYALLIGSVPAQGMQTQQVLFSGFPTTEDILDNAPSEAHKEMARNLEVPEVADYASELEANDFIEFHCNDENGELGTILIEEVEVLDASTASTV